METEVANSPLKFWSSQDNQSSSEQKAARKTDTMHLARFQIFLLANFFSVHFQFPFWVCSSDRKYVWYLINMENSGRHLEQFVSVKSWSSSDWATHSDLITSTRIIKRWLQSFSFLNLFPHSDNEAIQLDALYFPLFFFVTSALCCQQ